MIDFGPGAFAAAFAAGLLSFASPCVLPLIPGYLSFVSGVGFDELGARPRRVVASTAGFVLGFGAMFVALGAGAAWFGNVLLTNRRPLEIAAGIFIALAGLTLAGLRLPGALLVERRIESRSERKNILTSSLTGASFAVGLDALPGPHARWDPGTRSRRRSRRSGRRPARRLRARPRRPVPPLWPRLHPLARAGAFVTPPLAPGRYVLRRPPSRLRRSPCDGSAFPPDEGSRPLHGRFDLVRWAVLAVVSVLLAAALAFARDRVGHQSTPCAPQYKRYEPPHLDFRAGGDEAFPSASPAAHLHRAAGVDQIRAIDKPCFELPADTRGLLQPDDLVAGLAGDGEAHAYPIGLLSLHEVVNDVVGGTPIAVTWCPLCSTALAFDRRIGNRELHFGVSGLLLHSNQVLFDRETGSLWSQLLGRAVTGRLRGARLRSQPLVVTTWRAWLERYPHTRILSIRRDAFAQRFLHPFTRRLGHGFEESDQPYEFYESKVGVYFPLRVRGIADSELVLGPHVGGDAKAYPLDRLRRGHRVDDVVGRRQVLIKYDGAAYSAEAFARGRTGRLSPLPATLSYWFAWRRFYPRTSIYGTTRR